MMEKLRGIKTARILILMMFTVTLIGSFVSQIFRYMDPGNPSLIVLAIEMFKLNEIEKSPVFIVILVLILINLLAATIHRIRIRRKTYFKNTRMLSVDIIHIGLIIIIITAMLLSLYDDEQIIRLEIGDTLIIYENELELIDYETSRYNDGSLSSVNALFRVNETVRSVEINKPLRVDDFDLTLISVSTTDLELFVKSNIFDNLLYLGMFILATGFIIYSRIFSLKKRLI